MSNKMPVLFFGHGSPMNALAKDTFSQVLNDLGQRLPRPTAILCISAHWTTEGTFITTSSQPKTIHDFHGFPRELHELQYPAPGSPAIAQKIIDSFPVLKIRPDLGQWGFDHGSWGILTHLYPAADIPVLQLSLDMSKTPLEHLEIGKQLSSLRDQGILILGSGNVVHNLRHFSRDMQAPPFEWALQFDHWVKSQLENRNFTALAQDFLNVPSGRLSVADIDHYLPLFYIAGASQPDDKLSFVFEEIQNASISMRSFLFT